MHVAPFWCWELIKIFVCIRTSYLSHVGTERLFRAKAFDRVVFGAGSEMEKRADIADISVLFLWGCANFLAVYAQID